MLIIGIFQSGSEVMTFSSKSTKDLTDEEAVEFILSENDMGWSQLADLLLVKNEDVHQVNLDKVNYEF